MSEQIAAPAQPVSKWQGLRQRATTKYLSAVKKLPDWAQRAESQMRGCAPAPKLATSHRWYRLGPLLWDSHALQLHFDRWQWWKTPRARAGSVVHFIPNPINLMVDESRMRIFGALVMLGLLTSVLFWFEVDAFQSKRVESIEPSPLNPFAYLRPQLWGGDCGWDGCGPASCGAHGCETLLLNGSAATHVGVFRLKLASDLGGVAPLFSADQRVFARVELLGWSLPHLPAGSRPSGMPVGPTAPPLMTEADMWAFDGLTRPVIQFQAPSEATGPDTFSFMGLGSGDLANGTLPCQSGSTTCAMVPVDRLGMGSFKLRFDNALPGVWNISISVEAFTLCSQFNREKGIDFKKIFSSSSPFFWPWCTLSKELANNRVQHIQHVLLQRVVHEVDVLGPVPSEVTLTQTFRLVVRLYDATGRPVLGRRAILVVRPYDDDGSLSLGVLRGNVSDRSERAGAVFKSVSIQSAAGPSITLYAQVDGRWSRPIVIHIAADHPQLSIQCAKCLKSAVTEGALLLASPIGVVTTPPLRHYFLTFCRANVFSRSGCQQSTSKAPAKVLSGRVVYSSESDIQPADVSVSVAGEPGLYTLAVQVSGVTVPIGNVSVGAAVGSVEFRSYPSHLSAFSHNQTVGVYDNHTTVQSTPLSVYMLRASGAAHASFVGKAVQLLLCGPNTTLNDASSDNCAMTIQTADWQGLVQFPSVLFFSTEQPRSDCTYLLFARCDDVTSKTALEVSGCGENPTTALMSSVGDVVRASPEVPVSGLPIVGGDLGRGVQELTPADLTSHITPLSSTVRVSASAQLPGGLRVPLPGARVSAFLSYLPNPWPTLCDGAHTFSLGSSITQWWTDCAQNTSAVGNEIIPLHSLLVGYAGHSTSEVTDSDGQAVFHLGVRSFEMSGKVNRLQNAFGGALNGIFGLYFMVDPALLDANVLLYTSNFVPIAFFHADMMLEHGESLGIYSWSNSPVGSMGQLNSVYQFYMPFQSYRLDECAALLPITGDAQIAPPTTGFFSDWPDGLKFTFDSGYFSIFLIFTVLFFPVFAYSYGHSTAFDKLIASFFLALIVVVTLYSAQFVLIYPRGCFDIGKRAPALWYLNVVVIAALVFCWFIFGVRSVLEAAGRRRSRHTGDVPWYVWYRWISGPCVNRIISESLARSGRASMLKHVQHRLKPWCVAVSLKCALSESDVSCDTVEDLLKKCILLLCGLGRHDIDVSDVITKVQNTVTTGHGFTFSVSWTVRSGGRSCFAVLEALCSKLDGLNGCRALANMVSSELNGQDVHVEILQKPRIRLLAEVLSSRNGAADEKAPPNGSIGKTLKAAALRLHIMNERWKTTEDGFDGVFTWFAYPTRFLWMFAAGFVAIFLSVVVSYFLLIDVSDLLLLGAVGWSQLRNLNALFLQALDAVVPISGSAFVLVPGLEYVTLLVNGSANSPVGQEVTTLLNAIEQTVAFVRSSSSELARIIDAVDVYVVFWAPWVAGVGRVCLVVAIVLSVLISVWCQYYVWKAIRFDLLQMRRGVYRFKRHNFPLYSSSRLPVQNAANVFLSCFFTFLVFGLGFMALILVPVLLVNSGSVGKSVLDWLVGFLASRSTLLNIGLLVAGKVVHLVLTRSGRDGLGLPSVVHARLAALIDGVSAMVSMPIGLLAGVVRMSLSFVQVIPSNLRPDYSVLDGVFDGYAHLDPTFGAYASAVIVEHACNNPTVRVFCNILIESSRQRRGEGWANGGKNSIRDCAPGLTRAMARVFGGKLEPESASDVELQRLDWTEGADTMSVLSKRVRNRWHLAVLLIENPSLRSLRHHSLDVRARRVVAMTC